MTRPQPGAARTAARLSRLGHDAVLMPLFEATVTAGIDDLPPVTEISGLVATSARAFDMFEDMNAIAAGLADVRVHAVGAATAQAARDAGFEHVHEGGGTAQALAQALAGDHAGSLTGPRASNRSGRTRLVYLAGVPRTPVIEAAVKAQNINCTVVECYKMREISYSTDILNSVILSPVPDVILLYSANAARRIQALAEPKNAVKSLKSSRFLCLSASIAAELPQDLRSRVIVARRPDEDSLLTSLAELD
ncbi:MAG: uroporphyrinogen-III synthase [Hoeflea sp.]|uniref:uroporphyrinogen-III synthase n=1 Tax=Hoeflea sp. TaxID=1940281 RepID=UPI003EF296E1